MLFLNFEKLNTLILRLPNCHCKLYNCRIKLLICENCYYPIEFINCDFKKIIRQNHVILGDKLPLRFLNENIFVDKYIYDFQKLINF